jgi:hypothetical protein
VSFRRRGTSMVADLPGQDAGRKPDSGQAKTLEDQHGTGSLLMPEGRPADRAVYRFARDHQHAAPSSEPKVALALSAYALEHRVVAVPADAEVIDLGIQAVPVPCEHSWPSVAATADG